MKTDHNIFDDDTVLMDMLPIEETDDVVLVIDVPDFSQLHFFFIY